MFRNLLPAVVLCALSLQGAVVRIEVASRTDVLGDKAWGAPGPYERIVGKVHFAVDPMNESNRIVTDIDKAPRNAAGLVEFSSDLYVLKPRDPSRGNGAVLYEVSNRGNKGMLGMYNRAAGSLDPRTEAEFGDGFLMKQGYTLVWLGWQWDPPMNQGRMRLYAPVAAGLSGVVRGEFVPDARETSHSLADRDHLAYPVANPGDPQMTLTVRDRNDGPRRTIPRSQWSIEGRTRVAMAAGFEPGRIYEVVYTSQDPVLVGLGPAAVRDMMAYLKHGNGNGVLPLADQSKFIKRAYGFGVSQSGRFLRTFLYYGFNQDERKRKVFDGVMAHVAGGGRGSFNHRFAQPSRDGHPFLNMFYPTDIFPYTDAAQTDPETGLTDGILSRAEKDGVAPRIFYTNSSYEYWGRAASLIHTTIDGKKDVALAPGARAYLFAGGQHGPGAFPPRKGQTQNLPNPNPYTWSMRALLVAMDQWVTTGKEPPASQIPKIGDDKLVALGAVQFPKIPGVQFPSRIQKGYRADYGPGFRSDGIVTIEPPKIGGAFPTLVPQVDRDGNETAGIRMPAIQSPLATYTGWNLRSAAIGAPDELFNMVGSLLPFPKTRAEREKSGDPRLSIEERYKSRADYLARFETAARQLAKDGYLLEEDVPKLMERGAAEWDLATR